MPVSNGYRDYIIEQLGGVPALSTRRMFGGIGFYAGELFFALIDDDVLFFKVDDTNRGDYEARGMKTFCPFPDKPDVGLGYFQVPADVIEEAEELARWARRSIEVAQRKLKPPRLARAKATRRATQKIVKKNRKRTR